MKQYQPGILQNETALARYLTFSIASTEEIAEALQVFAATVDGDSTVVGFGQSLAAACHASVPGLRTFPALTGNGVEVPSTPAALWCWLRGKDRGELFHRSRQIESLLMPNFSLDDIVDCFQYDANRDLTGYEDGTENPKNDDAITAAIVQGQGAGLDGSSFVAVQQWLHDLEFFESLEPADQDNTFGRRREDNKEFDEAPESAHVKRAAQESYSPEAFIVRRSMPWSDGVRGGLNFIAFGKSFDAFETILTRMTGAEDGITDALFSFTRPLSGAYYWCPPMKNGTLDLSALGI